MKVTDIIAESKQPKEAPKPRNFVAKNAINTGAGQHKDKKRAEKQGDVKHKKQAVPMDEQSVAEGLGKTIKRSVAGWGAFNKEKPKDVVNKVKGQDTDVLKRLHEPNTEKGKGSPAELQQKAISRELKKREQGVAESATAGATSAGNVAVGAVYKNKPAKQAKNKDGTAKNALDMKANLMTGGSIKR
jgi:hypothetical protein